MEVLVPRRRAVLSASVCAPESERASLRPLGAFARRRSRRRSPSVLPRVLLPPLRAVAPAGPAQTPRTRPTARRAARVAGRSARLAGATCRRSSRAGPARARSRRGSAPGTRERFQSPGGHQRVEGRDSYARDRVDRPAGGACPARRLGRGSPRARHRPRNRARPRRGPPRRSGLSSTVTAPASPRVSFARHTPRAARKENGPRSTESARAAPAAAAHSGSTPTAAGEAKRRDAFFFVPRLRARAPPPPPPGARALLRHQRLRGTRVRALTLGVPRHERLSRARRVRRGS